MSLDQNYSRKMGLLYKNIRTSKTIYSEIENSGRARLSAFYIALDMTIERWREASYQGIFFLVGSIQSFVFWILRHVIGLFSSLLVILIIIFLDATPFHGKTGRDETDLKAYTQRAIVGFQGCSEILWWDNMKETSNSSVLNLLTCDT